MDAQAAKDAIQVFLGDLAGEVFITVLKKEILNHLQGNSPEKFFSTTF